jgi:hypothetical protein
MKRLFRATSIAVTLIFILSVVVAAAPLNAATTKTLSTNFALVNLGTEQAQVVAEYYLQDGSVWAVQPENTTFTVDGNYGQRGVAQYFDTVMKAGSGSVVISSSQPMGAVVQILARNQTATSGAYTGVSEPSNKYFVPQVTKRLSTANGISNSQIIIQNTDATATNVTVSLIHSPSVPTMPDYNKPAFSIPANSSYTYDLTEETDANLPPGWTGSAVVQAVDTSKKIAVVVNTFIGSDSLQTYNAFTAESPTDKWVIPMFTSRLANKLSTPVTFQNPTSNTIPADDVKLTCKAIEATMVPQTFELTYASEVGPNGAGGFNPVSNMNIPEAWSGVCFLESQGGYDMVVMTQLRRPGASPELAVYEAFPADASATSSTVVIPAMSKRQPNGFATTATIANLDRVNSALVKLTYTPAAGYVNAGGSATPIILHKEIPASGSIGQNLRFQSVPELPDGWYGTLLIEPDDGATPRPIVAIVQLTNYLNVAGDTMMAHDAINQ